MRSRPLLQLVLLLLVGLNLTLVCQGHESHGHAEGPHLAFLPETEADGEAHDHHDDQASPATQAQPGRSIVQSLQDSGGSALISVPVALLDEAQQLPPVTATRLELHSRAGRSFETGPEPPPPRQARNFS